MKSSTLKINTPSKPYHIPRIIYQVKSHILLFEQNKNSTKIKWWQLKRGSKNHKVCCVYICICIYTVLKKKVRGSDSYQSPEKEANISCVMSSDLEEGGGWTHGTQLGHRKTPSNRS